MTFTTVALALCLWLPWIGPAAASPARYANVEVDTSSVGETGPVLRRRIVERTSMALRTGNVLPGRGQDDPTVAISVSEITGDSPGFEAQVSVRVRGTDVADSKHDIQCVLCTEGELVERLEASVSDIVPYLTQPQSEPQGETGAPTPPHPTAVGSSPPTPAPVDDAPRSTRPGSMGKAGIGLLVAGAAATVAGIGLAVAPPRVASDDPTEEIYTQPPGYALLGVGAAVLITGAVLLGVDPRRRGRRVAIAPGPVLLVTGRF